MKRFLFNGLDWVVVEEPEAPSRIEVKPLARDPEIRERLKDILKATGWFTAPEVRVIDGVVFLGGMTETAEFKNWAGKWGKTF